MNDTKPGIALVTGATGFVGSHLARRLVCDGWRVHIITRPSSSLEQLKEAMNKVTVHPHDGTTENMLSTMQKAEPGIVFHLASLFIVEHQPKDVAQLIQSNLLFSTQLLEAMKQIGVNHLVNTGTSWQHYWNEDYNPVNLYAATKQAFEDILRYYLETTELKVITLKLFDTYGPDDPRPKLMHLLKRIVDSEEILAMSPGKQLIDLVHIYDVVEAYLLAARRLLDGTEKKLHSYAVSSGSPLSLKELAHLVGETLGRELNIKWGGRSYRKREVMLPWNTGLSLPGWHPHTNLKEGVRSIFSE